MKIKKYQGGKRVDRPFKFQPYTPETPTTTVAQFVERQIKKEEQRRQAEEAERQYKAEVVQKEKEELQKKYGKNKRTNTLEAKNNNTNIFLPTDEQQALRFMQYEPYPGAAYEYTQDYKKNTPWIWRAIQSVKKTLPLLTGHHPDVYEGTGIKRVGSEGGYYTGAYVPIKKEIDALGNVTSVKTPLAAKIGNIVMDSALLFDMGLSGLKAVAPSTYKMADQAVTSLPVAIKLRKGINKVDPANYDLTGYTNYNFLKGELSTPGYSVHVSPNYITESRVLRNGKTNPIELKAGHSNGTYWVPGKSARSEVEGTNRIWLYEDTPYHIHYGDKTFIQVPSKDLPYRPPQANTLGTDRIDLTKAEKIFQRNNVTDGIDRVIVVKPQPSTFKPGTLDVTTISGPEENLQFLKVAEKDQPLFGWGPFKKPINIANKEVRSNLYEDIIDTFPGAKEYKRHRLLRRELNGEPLTYYEVGTLPLQDIHKAQLDIISNRLKNFKISLGFDDSELTMPLDLITKRYKGKKIPLPKYFNALKKDKVQVIMPSTKREQVLSGFFDSNTKKSYISYGDDPYQIAHTISHEKIGHGTEDAVRLLEDEEGRMTSILYQGLATPKELSYLKDFKYSSGASKNWNEARSTTKELLNKILHWNVRSTKYTASEIANDEKLLNAAIDEYISSPEKLKTQLSRLPSTYAQDYARILESLPREQAEAYTNRWKEALKKWLAVSAVTTAGGAAAFKKQGGILKRKQGGTLSMKLKTYQQGGYIDGIKYSPSYNTEIEMPEIKGYQPQFSLDLPGGTSATEEQASTDTQPAPTVVKSIDLSKPENQTSESTAEVDHTTVAVSSTTGDRSYHYKKGEKEKFKQDLYNAYTKVLKQRGMNPAFAKYLVAQDGLESGWGQSYAGRWNFGNITKGSTWKGSTTKGKDKDSYGNPITQEFRNYDSIEDYANDKINLLNGKSYRAFSGTPEEFFTRVGAGGYVGKDNPKHIKKYVDKLTEIVQTIGLNEQGGKIPFAKTYAKLGGKIPSVLLYSTKNPRN